MLMLQALTLVTVFLNKIVGSWFHSLVTDEINTSAQDNSIRALRL